MRSTLKEVVMNIKYFFLKTKKKEIEISKGVRFPVSKHVHLQRKDE